MKKTRKFFLIFIAVLGLSVMINDTNTASAYTYTRGGISATMNIMDSGRSMHWKVTLYGKSAGFVGMIDYSVNGKVVGENFISGTSGVGASGTGWGYLRSNTNYSFSYRSYGGNPPIRSSIELPQFLSEPVGGFIYEENVLHE